MQLIFFLSDEKYSDMLPVAEKKELDLLNYQTKGDSRNILSVVYMISYLKKIHARNIRFIYVETYQI